MADRIKLEPGKWYFYVNCPKCRRDFAIAEDASGGTAPWRGELTGKLACTHCGHRACYRPSDVRAAPAEKLMRA